MAFPKQSLFLSIFILISALNVFSQTRNPVFVAFQPGITVEPFYEKGEFDINVFPFIIETPISSRVNLKLSPIINYHIGGESNGVSDLALFAVFPVFINNWKEKGDIPYGFYIGPVIGFGRNILNEHYTTTLAVEPGYMFQTKSSFTISLGLQLGASFFSYDSEPNKWVSHWGPKVSFGFWL